MTSTDWTATGAGLSLSASEMSLLRFGVVELDLKTGELRKAGALLRLPPQPFKILALLASRPGQLVTREEIQQEIWGSETFVDFELGLNAAIKSIRDVLGDDPETPRYIQTLPRRGYRFIAPVDVAPPRIESIAVLPLENLSGDEEQEYFADGMTEELINNLGQIEALRVISRTSVMQYKKTKKPLPEIARELNVDGIVEGSVLRSGDRVRITVQLIQAKAERHLWAESYERDLRDVLALQGEVARAIAREIQVKLAPQEAARLAKSRVVNPQAYEAYLKGRYDLYRWSAEAAQQALAHFQEAIRMDASYAPAYAGMADAYMNLGTGFAAAQPATEARPKGKVAALKALEIDPSLAEGHAALAATHLCYDWDWAATETELRRALELNPNYPPAHQWYSLLFAVRGQLEEALGAAKRAQELDLLAPYPGTLIGQILYYARRHDQARDQLRTVVERDANFALAHYWLGRAFLAEGVYADALEELQAAVRLSDRTPVMLGSLGYSYGVAGRGGEAQMLLEELQELSRRRYVPAYNRAEIYAGLGQRDEALEWLARARDERTDLLIFLNVDPVWDSLRSDPRFQALLRRMNFPP